MADLEKVIRGLEACNRQSYNGSDCQNCPYYDDEDTAELPFGICNIQDMFDDALALLKEQEPRVLTLEEIRSGTVEVAWIEDADKAEVIPGIWFRLSNEGGDEAVDIHIRDGFVGARLEVYGKLWRCWTSRPTDEQRKAVKWDEE